MTGGTAADRRLHPATVPLRFVKEGPSRLLALPAGYAVMTRSGAGDVIGFALLVGAVLLFFQWLAWRRFRYGIGEKELVIESGVFSRTRRSIPFVRIQDVDIEQGPLARLFGLARLRIETGGSGKDEGVLDSVALAEAERLRTALRAARGAAAPGPAAGEETRRPQTEPLFHLGPARLLASGLLNFSMVWIAGIFAFLQTFGDWLPFNLYKRSLWESAGAGLRDRFTLEAALLVLLVALVLGLLTGVARTFASDFGFRLTLEPEGLRRQSGLFTRSEVLIPRERMQLAAIESGPVRRLLGFHALTFQTLSAGSGTAEAGPQRAAPFASTAEIDRILAAVGSYRRAAADELEMVSSRRILRRLITSGLGPTVAVLLCALVFPPILFALPLVGLNLALAFVERRYHRFALVEGLLFVQSGHWRRRQWIVPVARVQSLTLRRSWLQRRLGLATMAIDTAGAQVLRGVRIADLREARARALACALIGANASSGRAAAPSP